jgi:hypothetical protein
MTFARRIVGVVSGLAVLSCILACGVTTKVNQAKGRMQRTNDLKQLGMMYHDYNATNQKGPPDNQTWVQWAMKMDAGSAAVVQKAGPGGQYTIYYGLRIPADFPAGTSNTVLGYENQPSGGSRLVLFADGDVRFITEAEFNAATKPAKK